MDVLSLAFPLFSPLRQQLGPNDPTQQFLVQFLDFIVLPICFLLILSYLTRPVLSISGKHLCIFIFLWYDKETAAAAAAYKGV